jgi:hypothetical protein
MDQLKGLRTTALRYLSEHPDDVTIYQMKTELQYSFQETRKILESFRKHGLLSRADKPGLSGRLPYKLTNEGERLYAFVRYLEKENLLSKEKDLVLGEQTNDKDRFLAKLSQGGFGMQDFEKALAVGLIDKGTKIVYTRYMRGLTAITGGLIALGLSLLAQFLTSWAASSVLGALAVGLGLLMMLVLLVGLYKSRVAEYKVG